jgi:hypothetical protein
LLAYEEEKVKARGRYVRFVPDEATGKLAVKRTVGNASVKEFWTVPDAKTTKLAWTVETDAAEVKQDGDALVFLDTQGVELFRSPAPVAWDADGKAVDVKVSFDGKVLSYEIAGEYKYPVTVDPSIVTATDATSGTVWKISAASIAASRDTTDASGVLADNALVISDFNGGNYRTYRMFLTFNTSSLPAGTIIGGKIVCLVSNETSPAGNFALRFIKSTQSGAIGVGWYNDFDGWAASGVYGVTDVADSMSFTTFATGDTIRASLNATGISLINRSGNTTFAILHGNDINNVTPSAQSAITLNDDSVYLEVTYYVAPDTRSFLLRNGRTVPLIKNGRVTPAQHP